ncbi:MAG: site-specific DNA-methyltransferase [Alphaproteobacteria bacterium]|nr:site-specific DNA-methyltransferase [Alphaproteobacteria bacterium]
MLDLNRQYCGNTFELIKQIDDNSIDLIVCDGPYGVTENDWDKIGNIQSFNLELLRIFSRVLKPGGSLYLFGKDNCIDFIDYRQYLQLNRRIIWYQPSRLAQGRQNYTNNYDLIAYFSKGKPKTFNLDAIRVPQMVELTQRRRCENVPSVKNGKYGKTKFNEDGKNPGDVWGDIKQLTYKSKELVSRDLLNTIQKPIKLIERLVLASSNPNDIVLDPFSGVGTTMQVCKKHNRNFIGFELNPDYIAMANKR